MVYLRAIGIAWLLLALLAGLMWLSTPAHAGTRHHVWACSISDWGSTRQTASGRWYICEPYDHGHKFRWERLHGRRLP